MHMGIHMELWDLVDAIIIIHDTRIMIHDMGFSGCLPYLPYILTIYTYHIYLPYQIELMLTILIKFIYHMGFSGFSDSQTHC